MASSTISSQYSSVLPLTREWIEIFCHGDIINLFRFSLLRGSGLKFLINAVKVSVYSSPSYEGVD